MGENALKFSKQEVIGSWDLKKYDIKVFDIPLTRRIELVVGSYNSAGVFKKFNIQHTSWGLCYVKSGSSKGRHFSVKEPIVERICYEIGKALGFDVTPYALIAIDMRLFNDIDNPIEEITYAPPGQDASFSKTLRDSGKVLVTLSKSFVGIDDTYLSCRTLYGGIKSENLYSVLCVMHGTEIKKQLGQMIIFDFIVHNTDRHTRNFGFLKDSSGQIQMAPLFDHGLAFLAEFDDSILQEDEMDALGHAMGQPFGSLLKAIDYVEIDSFEGLNLDIDIDFLTGIIDKYSDLLSPIRVELMKKIVERGVTHARKVLSSL